LVKRVHLEGIGCLVTDTHLGEGLEDLLKRGLLHTVLLDVQILLLLLDLAEQEADSFILTWHSQLVEVAALFKHLHLFEHARQLSDELEAVLLCKAELDES